VTETPKQRVWGRWVVLAAFLVGVYLFYVAKIPVIMPEVLLPAEEVFHLGGFPITNTLIALFFVDLIVFGIAFGVSRAVASGKQILGGISGAVEALIEMIYGMTEGTAGKWAKTIFPWFATIMLLVLVANWMEMIPGIETVGLIHTSEHGEFATQQIGPFLGIVKAEGEGGHALIPYVRVVSSDLNFTLAIAIVVVVMIQYYGIKSQGAAYFSKFWNVKTVFTKPIFGVIDFGVGLLEIVSEFSKVLSFAFRLFGNIFAGSVLLFVIGSLVPVFAQSIFYLLEFFVGAIQAFVFGLLATTFMAQATQGHGGEHHEEAHA
jgi:F-type H+-transporting ATPase subunit a